MTDFFVTRRIPEAGLRILREHGNVAIGQDDDERGVDHEALLHGVSSARVLVSLLTETIDAVILGRNAKLLGVANYAVGYNNIDLGAATGFGIPVTNTPGVLTESTADLTWALILAVTRRIPEAHEYMRSGRYRIWGPNLLLGDDIGPGPDGTRKVLGIIGFGRIGQAVARRATGFDMQILAYDPYQREAIAASSNAEWADFDTLLERSDIVTLHPLLTAETRHLIDEPQLRRMKRSAYLINVARGPVVHERALVRALREHWIAGAGLDVYEEEPAIAEGLADCPNVVLLPHIASATRDTRDRMATIAARNAVAHLHRERAPECVNPEVYDSSAYTNRIRQDN